MTVGLEDGPHGALEPVSRRQIRQPAIDSREDPVLGQEERSGMSFVAWVLGPVDALVTHTFCAVRPPDRVSLHPFAAPATDDEPAEGIGRGLGTVRTRPGGSGAPVSLRLAPYGLAHNGRHDSVDFDDL
jgi:hypothetical protein